MNRQQAKFIVTKEGVLRLGQVKRHRELLKEGERCLGGGFYELDYISHRLLLSGASSEFGEPAWDALECLKVSGYYKGLEIIYTSWDGWKETVHVSSCLDITYR